MTDEIAHKDALGRDLVIGARYGYSSSAGGWATTVVGTLKSIGKVKVTLAVETRKHFLYGKETEASWRGDSPTTSIQSFNLFPLN